MQLSVQSIKWDLRIRYLIEIKSRFRQAQTSNSALSGLRVSIGQQKLGVALRWKLKFRMLSCAVIAPLRCQPFCSSLIEPESAQGNEQMFSFRQYAQSQLT